MQQLTFGYLSIADVAPVGVIEAAARAGFRSAGVRITGRKPGDGFSPQVAGNANAVAELRSCLSDTGVRLSNVSAYHLYPEIRLDDMLPVIDASAAFGSRYIVAASYDPDLSRIAGLLGRYCRRAADAGLKIALEAVSYSEARTLQEAMRLVDAVGEPNFGLLLDPLHLARAGSNFADIAGIDPARIFYAQLCDAAAAKPEGVDLATEAKSMRLYPGEGGLKLKEFLGSLPAGVEIEVEVPVLTDRHLSAGQRAMIAHQKAAQYLGGI